jgi:hypothetical protein
MGFIKLPVQSHDPGLCKCDRILPVLSEPSSEIQINGRSLQGRNFYICIVLTCCGEGGRLWSVAGGVGGSWVGSNKLRALVELAAPHRPAPSHCVDGVGKKFGAPYSTTPSSLHQSRRAPWPDFPVYLLQTIIHLEYGGRQEGHVAGGGVLDQAAGGRAVR